MEPRALGKERLLVYLSEVTLPAGMWMRLSRLQAIHWYTYQNGDKAYSNLCEAQGLDTCCGKADQTSAPPPKAPAANPDAANAEALYRKGKEYEEAKDSSTAFSYYLKSAQMGYAPAQFAVGSIYERGDGVPQNKAEAVRWYRKAAEQGSMRAVYKLGLMYYEGDGIPQDKQEATKWLKEAAIYGDVYAQNLLEGMYIEEYGFPFE